MKIAGFLCAVLAVVLPMTASAHAVLTAGLAEQLVNHCEAEARRQKIALSIVVLDDGGHVMLAKRMDGARFKTIEVAEGKAYTALSIGAPSAVLQQAVETGKTSYLTVPGIVAIQGGLPILRDGVVIGAMGASGVEEPMDEACVQGAISALK
ncbi:GlcG/HbpS family heme-binding protein [Govanella unica]|uniref:Heme-binding protein n=1 Tax=Govanella unica TaxID=2975056 RepID=A0A9X3TXS9_9PROT|nr:heme-binding protein [Govania unica]MDA5193664.1 heme-binding protein [Govania unica]